MKVWNFFLAVIVRLLELNDNWCWPLKVWIFDGCVPTLIIKGFFFFFFFSCCYSKIAGIEWQMRLGDESLNFWWVCSSSHDSMVLVLLLYLDCWNWMENWGWLMEVWLLTVRLVSGVLFLLATLRTRTHAEQIGSRSCRAHSLSLMHPCCLQAELLLGDCSCFCFVTFYAPRLEAA